MKLMVVIVAVLPVGLMAAGVGGKTPGDQIRAIKAMESRNEVGAHWRAIVESLDDPNPGVQFSAVEALGSGKVWDALPALMQIAHGKSQPGLRRAADKSIRQFGAIPADRLAWAHHAHDVIIVHGDPFNPPEVDPTFGNRNYALDIVGPTGSVGPLAT